MKYGLWVERKPRTEAGHTELSERSIDFPDGAECLGVIHLDDGKWRFGEIVETIDCGDWGEVVAELGA